MPLKILVFYGSVRSERVGIGAARFVTDRCRHRGHEVELIDPVEYRLPLLDKMYKEYNQGTASQPLQRLADLITSADAYIVVSGEYNHTIPPALTNLLDHFLEEYFWKPSAIACYSPGMFGGVRAAMALRPMLAELGMPSIPSLLPMPHVHKAFDAEGKTQDPAWFKRADRFLEELEWYAEALRAARIKDGKDTCPPRGECGALQLAGN